MSLTLQLPKNKDSLFNLSYYNSLSQILVEDRMLNPFLLYMQQSNRLVEIRYSLFIA